MTKKSDPPQKTIPLHGPLLRGEKRPRVALIGHYNVGKTTIFKNAASPAMRAKHLESAGDVYQECVVDVGLDQMALIDLSPIASLQASTPQEHAVLRYLLWGDRPPPCASREGDIPAIAAKAPDVLIQVVDATTLQKDLELTLELASLGRPMLIALNRADEAHARGLFINVRVLSERLGIPVIPTVAYMGKGLSELFEAAIRIAREKTCLLPLPASPHIAESLRTLDALVSRVDADEFFRLPRAFVLSRLAENDAYFLELLASGFPALTPDFSDACLVAEKKLPRALPEEIHADRHHRAAMLFESVTYLRGFRGVKASKDAQYWLDTFFLHPRWGLIGSLVVFALVLLLVFEISAFLDLHTSARLTAWIQEWRPTSTPGVVGRAIADSLAGLVGIVVPYMLPLAFLLVLLEESGVLYRIAFVVDRGFHHIGLHGDIAVPFLIGLGCNVPAISAAAATGSKRDRVVASILVSFVPCSARSAIILAIGGKYLGGVGVFAILGLTMLTIALIGKLLTRHYSDTTPGMIQPIPPYSIPAWTTLFKKTWQRSEDIMTIVAPLLVVGSVVLALLSHFGADAAINAALTPVTVWCLNLPQNLGVPILFGVLRKELSLLMVYQALGTDEISALLDSVQIFTFLVFLTLYVPCVSTFAVMHKMLGRKEAWFSAAVSFAAALLVAGASRAVLELARAML
ncbi:MAG: ferrous iron transporter B [Candidatus Accumulibacter sp.]|jgi:ferrous iron transport protein B|nr:ferrous iron transporter B [Accumulibacter sp.]